MFNTLRHRNVLPAACFLVMLCAGLYRFSWDYCIVLGMVVLFILIPGFCCATIVLGPRKGDWIECAAVWFAFGVLFDGLFFFVRACVAPALDVRTTLALLGGSILILSVAEWVLRARDVRASAKARPSLPPAVVLVSVFGLATVLLFNENSLLLTSDALIHVQNCEAWAEKGQFGVLHTQGLSLLVGATRMYRSAIQPFFLRIGGGSAVSQYLVLTSIVGPLLLCSFYVLTKRLWDCAPYMWWSILLFLAHFGGVWFGFAHANYSWVPAWHMYFVSVALLLEYLRKREIRVLAGSISLALGTFLIHGAFLLVTVLSLASFLCCVGIWGPGRAKWAARALSGLVLVVFGGSFLLYGVDVLIHHVSFLDTWGVYRETGPILGHTAAYGSGYIVNPASGPARFTGLWGLAALVALPALIRSWRGTEDRSYSLLFLASNTVVPVLVLFNPVLVSVLLELLRPSGLERLIFTMPYISVVAWAVTILWQRFTNRAGDRKTRIRAAGLLLLVALSGSSICMYRLLALLPMRWGTSLQPWVLPLTGFSTGPYRYDHFALIRAMEYIRHHVPGDKGFLTDPITAELFPLYVKNPVLERYRMKFLNEKIARSKSMRILGRSAGLSDTVSFLRKHRIEYVLINDSYDSHMRRHYFTSRLDIGDGPLFDVSKFLSHPAWFEPVFAEDRVFLFRFRGGNAR